MDETEQKNEERRRKQREKMALWRSLNPDRTAEINKQAIEKKKLNPFPVSVSEKVCSTCKENKPADQFPKNIRLKSGLNSRCKKCQSVASARWAKNHKERRRQRRKEFRKEQPELHLERDRARYKRNPEVFINSQRKQKYGITPEQYWQMVDAQNERCAICQRHVSEFDRALAVDHCHKTDAIRGLLCGPCNKAIGLFKDDIELLNKAIEYLKRSS